MASRIRARYLLTEQGWLAHQQLTFEAGCITAIDPFTGGEPEWDVELLVPALIDGHVHGGAGVDVMDEEAGALAHLSLAKAAEGVGAFLATTVTAPLPQIEQTLTRIADGVASGMPGAQLLGSYLEGPYFTPEHKGAHDQALFPRAGYPGAGEAATACSRHLAGGRPGAGETQGAGGHPSPCCQRCAGHAGSLGRRP